MLSHLVATSPDCITLSELKSGRHTMVNAAFSRLTGYAAEEVVGKTATELGLWRDVRDRDRLRAAMDESGRDRRNAGDAAAALRRHAKVLVSAARFTMDGRAYMVVNARDVTESERTRLEHAAILERASIGIALTRDRRFVQANPRWEAIFGWEVGTMAGEPGAAVWVDADDYAEIGRVAGPLLAAGAPFETEREMKRRNGERFWCRLLGQAVDPLRPSHGGTIWIADDITERRRLDAALAAARDAAEAASRAKSAFLANTSHEIRTPLNGLLGLTRLALRESLEPALRRQYLEQIFESARGLEGILSDILDFSKIEAGKFTLDDAVFDLRGMLAGVHASYRSLAEAKDLALELAIEPALPARVRGDPVRVRQILGNFITNAVKFTAQGTVRIEAEPRGRRRAPPGRRHRQRHRRGASRPAVPAFLARRRVDDAAFRRHRPGPVDLPPARPPDGRRGRRGEQRRRRQHLLGRAAAGGRRGARRRSATTKRARASGCRAPASCWSRTTRST